LKPDDHSLRFKTFKTGKQAMPRELLIPSTASGDPNATEILRVWAAHGRQHVTFPSDLWDEPGNWGIMLVDLAKHVASAYEARTGADYGLVLNRIRELFDAEWETATDSPFGELES
jgi:hypothetical protein